MGGRGASSATAGGSRRNRTLPGNSAGFSLSGGKGPTLYFSTDSGGNVVYSRSASMRDAKRVNDGGAGLRGLYEKARSESQGSVKLFSSGDVKRAKAEAQKRHEHDIKEVDYGELHPNAGRAGYSAKRLLVTKTRANGQYFG